MPKRGYHHGNLRQALVDAALELIELRGPTGFTLSEAAKQAGVTPAAVYRHFEGREDLIAEAALQGYEMFADLMDYAYQSGQPSALAAFEATGRAYLAFARKHPGHYISMFESGISINRTPELAAAANRANGVLEKAAADLSQHIPADKRPRIDVQRPHLGNEPRRRRTLRPQQPRPRQPLPARGPAGKRYRHILARFGPGGAGQLRTRHSPVLRKTF